MSLASVCTWDGNNVTLTHGGKSLQILANSVIDKNRAGWFTLKKCFFDINQIDKTALNPGQVLKVDAAFATVKKTLERYRVESKQMIAAVLQSLWCGEQINIDSGAQLVSIPNNQLAANADIPQIFKNSFSKGVQLLKCTNGHNSKTLLVSAFGSEGATSDYDFNVFIIDNAAVINIQKQLYVYAKASNLLNKPLFTQVGQDQVVLTEDNLVLLENKEIYMNFSKMMVANFIQSSELVKAIYLNFEALIPNIKLLLDPTDAQGNLQLLQGQIDAPLNYKTTMIQPHGTPLTCNTLTNCYDSNAYPDTMAINRLVFKLPMSLLDKIPLNTNISFNKRDLDSLNMEYLHLSFNSICEYSELPAKKARTNELKAHLRHQMTECSVKVRGHELDDKNKHIGLIIMDNETKYFDDVSKNPASKTFPDCMARNVGHILEKVASNQTVLNFEDIFFLSNVIAVCTLYLDEGYFTFGALEHFKFGGNKAIAIQNFSLAESVKENLSMMLIHFEEKLLDQVAVTNQSYSDQLSKYSLRAFTAHEVLAMNLFAVSKYGIHLFDFDNVAAFISRNDLLKELVITDSVVSEFVINNPVIKKKAQYLHKDFKPKDILEDFDVRKFKDLNHLAEDNDVLTGFYGCLESYFFFVSRITMTKKVEPNEIQVFNPQEALYSDDNQKKMVYYERYSDFLENNVITMCPQITTAEQLHRFLILAVRSINSYMYYILNKYIKTFLIRNQHAKFMYMDDPHLSLLLAKVNVENIKEQTNNVGIISQAESVQEVSEESIATHLELSEHQHGGHNQPHTHGDLTQVEVNVLANVAKNATELVDDYDDEEDMSGALEKGFYELNEDGDPDAADKRRRRLII